MLLDNGWVSVIKLNKMTDYGTVVLSVLASEYQRAPQNYLAASEIAGRSGLTRPSTAKLLKCFAVAKLVEAERGKYGGYRLALSPHNIPISQIIEVLEGPIALTSCVLSSPDCCSVRRSCVLGGNWEKVNQAIALALESVSLFDLTNPAGMFEGPLLDENIAATHPKEF